MIDEPTRRKVYEMGQLGGGGVDSQDQGGPAGGDKKKNKKWGVGEMEFEAMMRMMDNAVSIKRWDFLTLLVPGDFLTLVYRGGVLFDPPLKMDFLRKKCASLCPGIKFDKILAIF